MHMKLTCFPNPETFSLNFGSILRMYFLTIKAVWEGRRHPARTKPGRQAERMGIMCMLNSVGVWPGCG